MEAVARRVDSRGRGRAWYPAPRRPHARLRPPSLPPPSLRKEIRTDSRAETACQESVSEIITVPSLNGGRVRSVDRSSSHSVLGRKLIGPGAAWRSVGRDLRVGRTFAFVDLYLGRTKCTEKRSQCNSSRLSSTLVDQLENRYDASRYGLGDFLAGIGHRPLANGRRGCETRSASASSSLEAERQAQ